MIKNTIEKKKNFKKLFINSYGLLLGIYLNVCFCHDTYTTCYFSGIFATKCKGGNDNISSNKPLNYKSLIKKYNT